MGGSNLSKSHDCCQVYTWVRPIGGGSSSCTERDLYDYGIDHSMVAFEYEDEVFFCDAVEEDGWLRGKWKLMPVKEFEEIFPGKKMDLGCHKLTKESLLTNLEKMASWGAYNLFANNCHTWVKTLLFRTGVHVDLLD